MATQSSICLVCVVLLMLMTLTPIQSTTCREASHLDIRRAALLRPLPTSKIDVDYRVFYLTFAEKRKMVLGELPRCEDFAIQEEKTSTNDRSLCPSYSLLNFDPDRIPNFLFEAKCLCNKCQAQPSLKDNLSLYRCEPLYLSMLVLRRIKCVDSVWKYAAFWEKIQSGCSCVYRVHKENSR